FFFLIIHNYSTKNSPTPITFDEGQFYNRYFGQNCRDMKIKNSSYDICDIYSLLVKGNPENEPNIFKFEMLILSMVIFRGLTSHKIEKIKIFNDQLDSNRPLSLNFIDSLHGIAASFISWFIISVLGLLGFLLIPLKKYKKVYIFTLQLLTALSFGTLSGDAIYHLLPHSLFDDTHDHSHEESHSHKSLELSVFLFGILFFYIIEVLIKWCPYTKNIECGCHSHNHNPSSDLNQHKHESNPQSERNEMDSHCHEEEHHHHHCINIEAARDIKDISAQHIVGVGFSSDVTSTLKKKSLARCHGDLKIGLAANKEISILKKTKTNCSNTKNALTTVLVILLADGAHQFCDGMSLASAYARGGANSYYEGISTALAIMLHEFPHKIGDIVLLVKCGYSAKKATIIVVGTSSISLLGVIMSQMLTAVGKPELPVPLVILSHIIGISLGLTVMILISRFE
ncbi:hypothetical protein MXB_4725, partial [Myxobolus squamalis]